MAVVAGEDDQAVEQELETIVLRLVAGDEHVHIQDIGEGVDMCLGVSATPDEVKHRSIGGQLLTRQRSPKDVEVELVHVVDVWERVREPDAVLMRGVTPGSPVL